MGAIKDKEYFPKTTSVTKDGWRVLVQYAGVYTRFEQFVAQKGDPLGSVIDGIPYGQSQKVLH